MWEVRGKKRKGGEGDGNEGGGEGRSHWCVKSDGGAGAGVWPVGAAGCYAGEVQPAEAANRKAAPADVKGAGRFGAGIREDDGQSGKCIIEKRCRHDKE